MAANLVNKEIRNLSSFVLPNLYGDIITDEAAQIQRAESERLESANIGREYAIFEAIH